MTKHELLAELAKHIGAERGVHVAELARRVRLNPRDVRRLVSQLREDGIAVCGHPSTGYFIAADQEELDRYCLQFLRSRAMHSLRLEARLRRIPLPDLIGQLKLPT